MPRKWFRKHMEEVITQLGDKLRVQMLAEIGLKQLPSVFVRHVEDRPALEEHDQSDEEVPIIDLQGFDDESCRDDIRARIGQACTEWGFFQVINHGLSVELMRRVMEDARCFFRKPMEEKLAYSCNSGMALEGYACKMLTRDDQIMDWRDYLNHLTLPTGRRNVENWPNDPPSYRSTLEEYSKAVLLLSTKLLAFISESLGLNAAYIEDAVGEPFQNIVMNYYPPCPEPDLTLGLQSHSDFGAITLLMEDRTGGLQVKHSDKWVAVKPIPEAFIVNLGDQIQIISNGRYKSVEHRAVVNSRIARTSIVAFYDPAKSKKISPAPQLVDKNHPALYKDVLFGEHVADFYTRGPEGKRNMNSIVLGTL